MSTRELAVKYLKRFRPSKFDSGVAARLPEAYRKFYDEWKNTPPKPVHQRIITGKIWFRDEKTGEIKRRPDNIPLPVRFPKELHMTLTGGEAVVQGFIKKRNFSYRVPRFWVPVLYKSVIYSEILDKYLSICLTNRAVNLIHEHQGLDNYILQTKACDLKNSIALKLKKKMLLALIDKDLPYDEKKNNEIYEKYKKFLIPREEIEWYGLNFTEACRKLKAIEEAEKEAEKVPLKHIFRDQLIQMLKDEKSSEKKGLIKSFIA